MISSRSPGNFRVVIAVGESTGDMFTTIGGEMTSHRVGP
jgi:hypothetical protein